MPGGDLSVGGENTRVGHVVGVADGERAVDLGVVSKGIVRAPHLIVDVLALGGGIGGRWVTHLQAEYVTTKEVNPLNNLGIRRVGSEVSVRALDEVLEVGGRASEAVGEDDTTERVTLFIGTVGVKLTTLVGGVEADLGLVDVTNDLEICLGVEPLHTGDGTRGDDAGAVARLSAPRDFTCLRIA